MLVVVKMTVDTQLHFLLSANFPASSTLLYRICNRDKALDCSQFGPLSPPSPHHKARSLAHHVGEL